MAREDVPPATTGPAEGVRPQGGLTSEEAARRLLEHGPNVLVPEERRRWMRWARALADPMAVLLLVAVPVYVAIGDTTDAAVTAVALLPVVAVSWVLEARAERALQQLRRLASPVVSVRRDGVEREVDATELVPGDVALVREGDVVPADGRLVEGTQLMIDEAALTGESHPVAKGPEAGADAMLAGTIVLSGRGWVAVTRTGAATSYGRIGTLVATVSPSATPLQRLVAGLVLRFGVGAALFCVAVLAAQLLHGAGWGSAVIAAVSLAIAAIPEEFPMVYTLYLALGAYRLTRENALVRTLPGVETLGSTSVICTDKTGTLTVGQVQVGALAGADGVISRDGAGPGQRRVLEAAVLASEPDPFDPLDRAIVQQAERAGLDVGALHAGTLVVDHPFDVADKYLSHVWRHDGRVRVVAKGSIEGMLAHCRAAPDARAAVEDANRRLAGDGMRVIAVAAGELDEPGADRAADEAPLELLGLLAFADPIRAGVADALAACRTAGIRVVLITGDHPLTAHAVAEALDLPHEDPAGGNVIVTGDDLDRAGEEELVALCRSANVFARTRPEQKHRLVRALRADGLVVAMTGDGINDAPALREADIGVAMGRRGTEVARESAAIVLLDDNFATIVAAVREGRRIFDNLVRAFAHLVAFHPPLLLAALIIPLVGEPLLLLPVQLVLLELVLHPVISLVFQADPPAPGLMTRPPRPRGSGLGGRELLPSFARGLTLASAVIASYLIALDPLGTDQARALGFTVLLLGETMLILVERSPHAPVWRRVHVTRALLVSVGAMIAVTLAALYLDPFADLLHLEPFPAGLWPPVIALAAVATLWSEPLKRHHRASPA